MSMSAQRKKKTNHIIKIKTKTERNEQKKPKHKNQKVFREFGLNLVRQQTSEFDSSKNYIIVFSLISVQNETKIKTFSKHIFTTDRLTSSDGTTQKP